MDVSGSNIADFIGVTAVEFFHDMPEFVELMNTCYHTGEKQHTEMLYTMRATGKQRYMDSTIIFVAPDLVVVHARDRTQRRQNELRIAEYQEQLRKLTSELTLAEEKERRRIAENLHDSVSQNLAAAKLSLDTFNKCEDESCIASIASVRDIITDSINSLRTLTVELSPPVLYELGLPAAVKWLGDTILNPQGITLAVTADPTVEDLNNDMRVMLFLCIRELLMNIVKHSGAQNAAVSLSASNAELMVVVKDDGKGYDPDTIPKTSFGLFSVRERLRYLGGTIAITSESGKGARVAVTAPL
jgi:signal transduction histidine kinase